MHGYKTTNKSKPETPLGWDDSEANWQETILKRKFTQPNDLFGHIP